MPQSQDCRYLVGGAVWQKLLSGLFLVSLRELRDQDPFSLFLICLFHVS